MLPPHFWEGWAQEGGASTGARALPLEGDDVPWQDCSGAHGQDAGQGSQAAS